MGSQIVILGDTRLREVAEVVRNLPIDRLLLVGPHWLTRGKLLNWSVTAEGTVLRLGRHRLALADVGSIFHRPGAHLDPRDVFADYLLLPSRRLDPGGHAIAKGESESALIGALLATDGRWINHPCAERRAAHTTYQLTLAHGADLAVPATLVSSDQARLAEFWHEYGGAVITKAVSRLSDRHVKDMPVTHEVGSLELNRLTEDPSPVWLFQEYVPATFDVRVILVGEEDFTCAIHRDDPLGGSPRDRSARMSAHRLDDKVIESLHEVRNRLGLLVAGAHLRVTPGGTPVFLSMTPRPDYSLAEHRTGAPIAAAIARLLLDGP